MTIFLSSTIKGAFALWKFMVLIWETVEVDTARAGISGARRARENYL